MVLEALSQIAMGGLHKGTAQPAAGTGDPCEIFEGTGMW